MSYEESPLSLPYNGRNIPGVEFRSKTFQLQSPLPVGRNRKLGRKVKSSRSAWEGGVGPPTQSGQASQKSAYNSPVNPKVNFKHVF